MVKGHTEFMSAEDGVVVVNDTTAYSSNRFYGIYFCEDTVISNLEVDGTASDVKGNYITTPATAVKQGTLITVFGDSYFSKIQLTSGSVALIL